MCARCNILDTDVPPTVGAEVVTALRAKRSTTAWAGLTAGATPPD